MMFANERLFVAELIESLDELHIALETQSGVFANPVESGHEDTEFHL
jgi:hypothetical protein